MLNEPRPFSFNRAELTAGLRSFTGDPTLNILSIQEQTMPYFRPALGRIRGLNVLCEVTDGPKAFSLVLKEPQTITRAGMTGSGWREVSFYRTLAEQTPLHVPQLLAAQSEGRWLVLTSLTGGIQPSHWSADNYLIATDQLAGLHDRFWGLGEDLATYRWLARPLDADFAIYITAAAAGLQKLRNDEGINTLNHNLELIQALERLIEHAGIVATGLHAAPDTLLHGDYWPGNLSISPDNHLVVYDWQRAAIGPGVLDLFYFVQESRWYFDPLPLTAEEIVARYRQDLAQSSGHVWADDDWAALWDYSLLWTFLSEWTDLLPIIPNPLMEARIEQFQKLWLEPVCQAVTRRLPEV